MNVIESLAQTPDHLEAVVRGFPVERLGWLPSDWNECPAEGFSALGHVCHMRDIEREGYHVRFDRVLREHSPDLPSVDGAALARERRYHDESIDRALADFRAAREATIHRMRAWPSADLARTATFSGYGVVTAEGLLHVLRSHDLQHLAGLHWLVARFPVTVS